MLASPMVSFKSWFATGHVHGRPCFHAIIGSHHRAFSLSPRLLDRLSSCRGHDDGSRMSRSIYALQVGRGRIEMSSNNSRYTEGVESDLAQVPPQSVLLDLVEF